jgi:hypothetical protein
MKEGNATEWFDRCADVIALAALPFAIYAAYRYRLELTVTFKSTWIFWIPACAPLLSLMVRPKVQKSWIPHAVRRYRKYTLLMGLARIEFSWLFASAVLAGGTQYVAEVPTGAYMFFILAFALLVTGVWAKLVGNTIAG